MKDYMLEWELSKRIIPWINDHVIISIGGGLNNLHGVVTNYDTNSESYEVRYSYQGVFHIAKICIDEYIDESIEIDVQYYRDLKLKELGI